jgi:tetratricopeptide (TPR) repeat protein
MDGRVELLEAPVASARRDLAPDVRTDFEAGRRALDEGRLDEALVRLRAAHAMAGEHALVRSTLGLAIARGERDFAAARTLCEAAAKQEFFNPEVYLNLARVYLCFDRRSEALRYLRRGQMIDPGHRGIQEAIAALGRRRLPLLPFLPRRHPFNRMLGTARSRLLGAFRRRATRIGPPVDTSSTSL